jgi:GntP family permease
MTLSDLVELIGIPRRPGPSDLACVQRLERASARPAGGARGGRILAQTLARALDADIYAQRRRILRSVLPALLAQRPVGKLIEDAGSVTAIANFMIGKLGANRAILAVVLGGAIVTYGGVSLFVAFFVIAPMAQDLFLSASIPRRLMPAAIMLGTSRYTVDPEHDSDAFLRHVALRRAGPWDARLRDYARV